MVNDFNGNTAVKDVGTVYCMVYNGFVLTSL